VKTIRCSVTNRSKQDKIVACLIDSVLLTWRAEWRTKRDRAPNFRNYV